MECFFKKMLKVFISQIYKLGTALTMKRVRVTTCEGILEGYECTNIQHDQPYFSFQGIPYALPPTKKRRFKDPKVFPPWEGIKDATKDGFRCYSELKNNQKNESEDCLSINVYTPKVDDDNLMPVMVFIHGGAFLRGGNTKTALGPDFLIREDVVLAVVNYRVGVLGFLALEDPSLEVAGNTALKDVIMALKWVQRNIRCFGGDPSNVTVFGESSGAVLIHYLVLSPLVEGLFHKAILQSASALNNWALVPRFAKHLGVLLGIKTDDERDLLKKLQECPIDQLMDAQNALPLLIERLNIKIRVGPVVEYPKVKKPRIIDEHPLVKLKEGKFQKLPIMFGYTSREGMALENYPGHIHKDIEWYIPPFLKVEKGTQISKLVSEKIRNVFFNSKFSEEERVDNFNKLLTDSFFFKAIHDSARYHQQHLNEPVYFYRMSIDTELNRHKRLGNFTCPGACHGDDLTYLFYNRSMPVPKPGSLEDVSVRRFCRLWANFAKFGDPTPKGGDTLIQTKWRPVDARDVHFLDIDKELSAGVNPEADRVRFWDELLELVEQHRHKL